MNVGILISARNKSKRLKHKLFLKLGRLSVIEYLIRRAKNLSKHGQIILSTSIDKRDEKLIKIAKNNKIPYFAGHKDDKLKRYYSNAIKFNLDAMIIIDGDDPLFFSDLIIKQIKLFKKFNYDCIYYKTNHVGISCFLIKTTALKKIIEKKTRRDTEVWGHYFINNKKLNNKKLKINLNFLKIPLRLTLDYYEDFKLIKKLVVLTNFKTNFPDNKFKKILKRNIRLLNINSVVVDQYNKNLKLIT